MLFPELCECACGIPEFQCLDAEGLDDIRNDKEALLADAARRAEALAEVF